MRSNTKTMIVTGASQGIGAGVTKAFIERGYNVVANSRDVTRAGFVPTANLALVSGDISEVSTAQAITAAAMNHFGSIDGVINNAGIFYTKPFTDFADADFDRFVETNLKGFFHITQLAVKQMLAQGTGGSIISVTASLSGHPIAGVNASVPMITKGGLETATRHLAMEYAKNGIRFNAIAPGVVDTPMHAHEPKETLSSASPMGTIVDVDDIVAAVLYLSEARHVTGEILHVDGGAHIGKW